MEIEIEADFSMYLSEEFRLTKRSISGDNKGAYSEKILHVLKDPSA